MAAATESATPWFLQATYSSDYDLPAQRSSIIPVCSTIVPSLWGRGSQGDEDTAVLRVEEPSRLEAGYQRFGGTYCLHFKG